MLKVDNVSKKFSSDRSVEAVSNVSLEVDKGQFLAVVGRSGSGKSTLLAMIGGINKPTSGTILINSINQWSLNDDRHSDFRNQTIGFVFQFASLLPTLRAIDNVALPALIGGTLNYKDAYARAHTLLNHVGLGERFDSFPGQLSGGEQRRVAIARALINSPSVILADEPTADLDQETEEEILNLLLDIHRTFNLTMVVVTHSASIAEKADKVLRMNKGVVESVEQLTNGKNHAAPTPQIDAPSIAEEIFQTSNEPSIDEKIRLGEGVERLVGHYVIWLIPVILIVWGINVGVATYERNILDAKENQRIELEDLAMKGLRADVKNVTTGPGKSYTVTLYLHNTTGTDKPIYVMAPAVRGFVQVGTSWQEVAMKPVDTNNPKVLKITGNQTYDYILEPDVTGYAQLLPYYMHVRISNDMIVSPSDQPKTDLIERNDNYYVYLRPHDLEDAKILQKMKFPGKPPVWIPMPPH
ncbi:hypothetical protein BH10CYA1_BH10CYA1_26340 [soil metagenome]